MSTDIAVRPSTEIVRDESPGKIATFLTARVSQLAKCCPSGITPEAMIQVASLIVRKTPKLQECDPDTIFTSMIDAGACGFSLNPTHGECYLVPRWNKNTGRNECSMQPGYRGLAKLVRGNGKIEYIIANVVHEHDLFDVALSPEPVITHKPLLTGDRGKVTWVYSMVKFLTGTVTYDYMSFADVEKVRAKSQSPNGTFWGGFWDEMAKKTVIRRHSKSLDQTPQLAKAIELDNIDYQAEESPKAIVDNGTGHGNGRFATPEHAEKYRTAVKGLIDKRNQGWVDRWTNKQTVEIPEKLQSELTRFSLADTHLSFFARDTKMIEWDTIQNNKVSPSQEGRIAAIPFCRSKDECARLWNELKSFLDRQEEIAVQRLQVDHPELFGRQPGDDEEIEDLDTAE